MNKTYSVLMSVYYKENPIWLRESIDSILKQSISPSQLVIVKDGPLTEELDEVLKEYTDNYLELIRVVELPENMGLGIALQKGVLACEHEIVVRMDTDDYAMPERVEQQLLAMEQHKADIVSSNIGEFQSTIEHVVKYKEVPETQEAIYSYAKRRNPFNHPAVMFRKSKVLEAGNYQKCDWIEDYDLWIRMLQKGCIGYNVQEPLLLMRVSDDAYRRRGGWQYLKSMLAFNVKYYKQSWYSLLDFCVRSAANILMALSSNRVRNRLYKGILRK